MMTTLYPRAYAKFLLSTAEAVLRQETIATEETKNAISVAYRLGGIEAPY